MVNDQGGLLGRKVQIIVRDDATGAVVGTYRMLSPKAAERAGRRYGDGEFDLGALRPLRDQLVETICELLPRVLRREMPALSARTALMDDQAAIPLPESTKITFTAPGTYHYFCAIHGRSMAGDIIVQ